MLVTHSGPMYRCRGGTDRHRHKLMSRRAPPAQTPLGWEGRRRPLVRIPRRTPPAHNYIKTGPARHKLMSRRTPPAHNYIKPGPARLVRISPQNISGRTPLKTDPSFRPTDNAIDDVMRRRRAVSLGGARIARALATTRRERKKSCWRRPATRFSITATAGRAPTRFLHPRVHIP